MPPLTSVTQLDLSPKPGKTYFNIVREWREEFIYFVMVDRFHDTPTRTPTLASPRSTGFAAPDGFYGGTLKGIKNNLDYIAGLGCTSIWLSPVFETRAYHGYDITNYLDIDPHFGTKQDLIDLVDAAHARPTPMRIILDVVINHSGDNFEYAGGPQTFDGHTRFDFGSWRRPDRPVPTELRNEDWYHRRGSIRNYDTFPENQLGDISGLKDFANDDDAIGSDVINTLIQAHCYWIREADIDGFRVDAVKHMSDVACSRFCSNIREYAYSLGKRGFFLFGEVATPDDDVYNRYIGQNTSTQAGNTVFFGLNSVLDFRLAEGVFADDSNAPLRDILKNNKGPQTLFNRLEAQRLRALNRGEIGRYLVTFVDNHDSFWQPGGRFANGADDDQVIAAIGYLLCSLGTACIYYGTEQGFEGSGGDVQMREGMFDKSAGGKNLMNTDCHIYKEIAKIAQQAQTHPALRFGRMYFREIARNGDFGLPFGNDYTLAFSRIAVPSEVLVAYNVSPKDHSDTIVVDATLHPPGSAMKFLYGRTGTVPVKAKPGGGSCIQFPLGAHKFAILG